MARRRVDDLEVEREFEERVEAKRRGSPARSYPEPQKRDKAKTKPPLLLRLLAWCGVILFCFVVGYVGTEYVMTNILKLDQQVLLHDGAAAPTPGGVSGATAASVEITGSGTLGLDIQKATFSVFYPKDGNLVSENVDVISRTLEDNIQETVTRILSLGGAGDAVSVLHVFRDVDTVYLDLSGNFVSALNAIGEQTGLLLINGVVRTMRENFSLAKVRFLVDSRLAASGGPVDLSTVWQ